MRQRNRLSAKGCSAGSVGTASRMMDHANCAGSSTVRCAATPKRSASSNVSQRPSVGCGTTMRSGSSGCEGASASSCANRAAKVSSRLPA